MAILLISYIKELAVISAGVVDADERRDEVNAARDLLAEGLVEFQLNREVQE